MYTKIYDNRRNELREKLTECLTIARELLDENSNEYDEMPKEYALDIYIKTKELRDSI